MTHDRNIHGPERALVLSYAAPPGRAGLAALLDFDDSLAQLLRSTSQSAVGQLRLAWWRESLAKLDSAPAPAQPVLQALERDVLPRGVTGASLVPIVHGWEVLVEEERLDADALERFAAGRGTLFKAGARLLGAHPNDPVAQAGRGWALADLSRNLEEAGEAAEARRLALSHLAVATSRRWSRAGRPLGALAHLSRLDLANPDAPPAAGSPRRVGRLLWHRLTGL